MLMLWRLFFDKLKLIFDDNLRPPKGGLLQPPKIFLRGDNWMLLAHRP